LIWLDDAAVAVNPEGVGGAETTTVVVAQALPLWADDPPLLEALTV
jgi:hypothetical protein